MNQLAIEIGDLINNAATETAIPIWGALAGQFFARQYEASDE